MKKKALLKGNIFIYEPNLQNVSRYWFLFFSSTAYKYYKYTAFIISALPHRTLTLMTTAVQMLLSEPKTETVITLSTLI